jgi:hypothetical protein
MRTLTRIERFFTALALSPLTYLEQKERERKLDERLKRVKQKQKHL